MKVGDKVKVAHRKWGDHIGATGVIDYMQDDGLISVMLDGYPFRYYAPFVAGELELIKEEQA